MIVVEKIHLAHHFGRSFRDKFGNLRNQLFLEIHYASTKLFLAATCTRDIIEVLKLFIGVNINAVHWPENKDSTNKNVRFNARYTTQWFPFI